MVRALLIVLAVLVIGGGSALAETTIVFWHWNDPQRQAAMQPLFEQLERETGIRVEAQEVSWAELPERLLLGVAAGIAPDVTAISGDLGVPLAFQGVYEDLRPWLARESQFDYDDLLPNALEQWRTADGLQFGFPFDLDLRGLFYNKSIFDAAGIAYPDDMFTWDEMLSTGKRLTVDRTGDGFPDQYGFANGHIALDTFVWSNGGELLTPDGKSHALNTPQAREALDYFKEISAADVNMAWGDATRFGYPHPPAAFAGDRIAMYPLGAWAPSAFWREASTGEWLVEFDVTHLPLAPSGERNVHLTGQAVGMISTSEKKEAAWQFIQFMASPEVQRVSAGELGQFPVLRSVALSDAFLVPGQPPENLRVFVEATAYARNHPHVPNWAEAWAVMRTQVATYLDGSQPLTSVLQTLDELVPPILSR